MRAAGAALLFAAGAASAWPVDVYLDLEVGKESFQRPAVISWVEVEDPKIASAEVLESGELLFTGVAPGRTLALLYAEGKMAVWRLRVAAKGEKPKALGGDDALAAAKKACPRLEATAKELIAPVKDEKCRQALLALFQTDAYAAGVLDLTFEIPAVQSQLATLSLPRGLAAKYSGPSLVLTGEASVADHRRALWELFRKSAGRIPLDDQSERSEPTTNNQRPTTNNP